MDDGVGTAEVGGEVVGGHVGCGPRDLREVELRQSACKAEHGLDARILREQLHEARPDVARRADHDHTHQVGSTIPSSSTSVKNACAYGEPSVASRTRSQSICSRSGRTSSSSES